MQGKLEVVAKQNTRPAAEEQPGLFLGRWSSLFGSSTKSSEQPKADESEQKESPDLDDSKEEKFDSSEDEAGRILLPALAEVKHLAKYVEEKAQQHNFSRNDLWAVVALYDHYFDNLCNMLQKVVEQGKTEQPEKINDLICSLNDYRNEHIAGALERMGVTWTCPKCHKVNKLSSGCRCTDCKASYPPSALSALFSLPVAASSSASAEGQQPAPLLDQVLPDDAAAVDAAIGDDAAVVNAPSSSSGSDQKGGCTVS